jgi:hypothetical protein
MFGIKSYGEDGYLNLHSDYGNIVYIGHPNSNNTPTAIQVDIPESQYYKFNLGWTIVYYVNTLVDFIIPFYKPAFLGQEVAIRDVFKNTAGWEITLVFSGGATNIPEIYLFSDLASAPNNGESSGPDAQYGVRVMDANGNITFRTDRKILKVDSITEIVAPTAIRVAAVSGSSCKSTSTCDQWFDLTPDTFTYPQLDAPVTDNTIFSLISDSYGSVSGKWNKSWDRCCNSICTRKRKYVSLYATWCNYVSSLRHVSGNTMQCGWIGAEAGKFFQAKDSPCRTSLGGWFDSLLSSITLGLIDLGPDDPSLPGYQDPYVIQSTNNGYLLVSSASYYD